MSERKGKSKSAKPLNEGWARGQGESPGPPPPPPKRIADGTVHAGGRTSDKPPPSRPRLIAKGSYTDPEAVPLFLKNVTLVEGEDWIGIYVDGELRDEGHSLSEGRVVSALGVPHVEITWGEDEWEESGYRCPKTLEEAMRITTAANQRGDD